MAPSVSQVATTAPQVEQLDLFASLAPGIATPKPPSSAVTPRSEPTSTWPFAATPPLAVESVHLGTEAGALTASVFDAYHPAVRVPSACPHPTRLVESAAMAAATAPQSDYRPRLPDHLVSRGLLSDAQLETVVRAGSAHLGHLPGEAGTPGPRQGFFLGDGTGVGKMALARSHAR